MTAPAAAALARAWIAAWNSRDLEQVLALYDDEVEMASAGIIRLGLDASGCLKGKDLLHTYWSRALQGLPDLHFELLDAAASPDSIIIRYRNERGAVICEYLRLNANGRIAQGSANTLLDG